MSEELRKKGPYGPFESYKKLGCWGRLYFPWHSGLPGKQPLELIKGVYQLATRHIEEGAKKTKNKQTTKKKKQASLVPELKGRQERKWYLKFSVAEAIPSQAHFRNQFESLGFHSVVLLHLEKPHITSHEVSKESYDSSIISYWCIWLMRLKADRWDPARSHLSTSKAKSPGSWRSWWNSLLPGLLYSSFVLTVHFLHRNQMIF